MNRTLCLLLALSFSLLPALAGCGEMGMRRDPADRGPRADAEVRTDRDARARADVDRSLVGTWRGREDIPDSPFQFASVTFAPDGTYTAHMRYEGGTRADSGKWRTEQDRLVLEEGRTYRYSFEGRDTVVFTDPRLNISVSLDRLR